MFKLWKAAASAALLLSFSVLADPFVEGKHYSVVSGQQSDTPKITEYFSFYCPACFRQEPFMAKLGSMLPEGSALEKVHVTGMPGRDAKSEELLTQALVVASKLNLEKEVVQAIFNAIHLEREQHFQQADLVELFVKFGAEQKKVEKTLKSFAVKGQSKKMAKRVKAIREQGHSAVPTLVINDKFVPNIRSISSMQEYEALVKFLLDKTA